MNYLTAYALLVVMGSLHAGESVLIHNAGGGVGLAALDIAKKIGAVTYGTASQGKHKFLTERGLDHPIDYRNQDWQPELQKLTNGRGVDLVIDPIGGEHWKKSYASLRHTGRLGCLEFRPLRQTDSSGKFKMLKAAIQMPWFHPLCIVEQESRCVWFESGPHVARTGEGRSVDARHSERCRRRMDQPHVDQVFSFDDAGKAHRRLEERKNTGKVVLVPR